MATSKHEILKKYWGYDTFRPLQEEIIDSVLAKHDTLALLPTGGGKSICFQVPTLIREGLCIVVSPLIALMKDQVHQLRTRGIPAEAVYSGLTNREIDVVLDNCVYGKIKFLYLSPERLQTDILKARVQKMNVSLLAIDEAHCISQWGYDFRPPYLRIAEFRELIPEVNVLALTATATEEVKKDIIEKLSMRGVAFFQKSFARKNLAYIVKQSENKLGKLLHILKKIEGSTIIYTSTRKKTKIIADLLTHQGISATYYNAGLDAKQRDERQDAWFQDRVRVIVATNAFGMGIDKPNVRLVVHLDLPSTLEAYYQEAGRAGRDERGAYAILLFEKNDETTLLENLEATNPTLEKIKSTYQHLANYYSIAMGSHNMVTYDFDVYDFCERCGLKAGDVYPTIKVLEQQGLVQMNETFFERSKIFFDLSTKDLYAFQVANPKYDPLIKALLRTYGGDAFSTFVSFSKAKIATIIGVSIERVNNMLTFLDKTGVLKYSPQKEQPQITFTTVRMPTRDLPIDTKFLKIRQTIAKQKCDAMIQYATHKLRCRQQILLEYFGEVSYDECKKCDICLAKAREKTAADPYLMYREIILDRLKHGPCTESTIVDSLGLDEESGALEAIATMLHYEEITRNDFGLLAVKE